jgi:2-oxoisovalerate dehydrogenase E1 component
LRPVSELPGEQNGWQSPEFLRNWSCVRAEFRHEDQPFMSIHDSPPAGLGKLALLRLYEQMMLLRRFELTAQQLYKRGEMPGFIHLYIGEEATAVGVCAHLRPDDWITSTHRGHGHALGKGVPPALVLAELFGKATGCCGGRGGSMHLYYPPSGLFGTNGLVGAGIPLTVGIGISAKVRKNGQVGVAFFGDGAVNHGAFHESINFAAVQNAPVLFLCENNLYATATPLNLVTRNTDIASRAASYGIPGVAVDGNDVVAIWQVAREAIERARSGGGPTLIEARTYRVVGHHEGDPVVGVYRTQQEIDAWKKRCPIETYRTKLLTAWQLATAEELDSIDAEVERRVQEAVAFARTSPEPDPDTLHDHIWAEPIHAPLPVTADRTEVVEQGWLDAMRDGIAEEMRRDPHLLYFGEGIGERGGSFAHTKGLWHEFGGERVIDTPISELGFTGAAIGASATGCRSVADLMFIDFLFEAASQVVHQAAKLRYMSNGKISVPVVLRTPMGAIKNAGPHHSGTYYPIWAHVPGLLVVVPSSPAEAKALIKTALRARDPVIFLEHKAMFATKGPVPVGEHLLPFGQANVIRHGKDITLVSCGLYVHRCLEAADQLQSEGIDCEVIDLRTIVPLDVETIASSVARTRRLLVVDEAYAMCGLGAEIGAAVTERVFDELEAPIGRLHPEPVSYPFAPALDRVTGVSVDKIVQGVHVVLEGHPPLPYRAKAHGKPDSRHKTRDGIEVSGSHRGVTASRTNDARSPAEIEAGGEPLLMPHGDLTVTEAKVIGWLKKVGDTVQLGEGVVEVETDKVTFAVESPITGRLASILTPEGAIVTHGQQLGVIQPS